MTHAFRVVGHVTTVAEQNDALIVTAIADAARGGRVSGMVHDGVHALEAEPLGFSHVVPSSAFLAQREEGEKRGNEGKRKE